MRIWSVQDYSMHILVGVFLAILRFRDCDDNSDELGCDECT